MSCARCGCGIYKTEEFISLNKIWHKYCFTCCQCNKRLDTNCAKIFQGELFCEGCYTSVIEKLFEVISTPSLNRPCKVVSTPSCAASKTFVEILKDCDISVEKVGSCFYREFCFPAEKNNPIQRNVQSCSCIPNQTDEKNDNCIYFSIPREVANYYNRSHMRTQGCKKSTTCCTRPRCPACSCRKTCCPEKIPPCCSKSCPPPRCGGTRPKECCCSKPPPPCTPVFTRECGCCLQQDPTCYEPCLPPQHCTSSRPPPCKTCQYCQRMSCKPKPFCPPPICCPPKCFATSTCPPAKWFEPQPCFENPRCCKNSTRCYCRVPKYCVCGNLNPCNCKMSQIKAQCTVCCNRCGHKVYAAEKVLVSFGAYHTSCFTCYCCNKCLDVKNVFEGCGEIYCKQCYNHFFGAQYYGFGRPNC